MMNRSIMNLQSLFEKLFMLRTMEGCRVRCRASLLLQTRTLSLFQEYLENPTFLRKDSLRSSYHLPPFRHICLLQLKETDLRRKIFDFLNTFKEKFENGYQRCIIQICQTT